MAKGRMLQKRISNSRKMALLSSDTVRLLYTWMLAHLDINGCFFADPVMVNNIVFTRLHKPIKLIADALDELESHGLIIRYESGCEKYLHFPDFEEKQPSLQPTREGKPDIPPPTTAQLQRNSRGTPEELQSNSRGTPEELRHNIKENNIKENKITHMECVLLRESEFNTLISTHGEELTKKAIEILNNYIMSTGKKYKSHYHVILNWGITRAKEELKKGGDSKWFK